MRQSKYRNKRVVTKDGVIDSVRESKRWEVLKQMEAEGKITELNRQVPFTLVPSQKLEEPRITIKKGHKRTQYTELAVKYFADFTYMKDGQLVVEDSKGMRTPDYVIKRKLMKYLYGIEIKEV